MKRVTKESVVHFCDRRKHPADKNLRLVSILLAIILIIGVFLPLIGANFGLLFKAGNGSNGVEVPIAQPNNSIVEVSTGDFVFQKPLKDYEIFGQKIGDMSILGLNVYDLLTTPFPDISGLSNIESFLGSGTLSFLVSDGFVNFCNNNLGDFGQGLISVGKTINDISTQAQEVLSQVTKVLNDLSNASNAIRMTIDQINGYLGMAGTIVLIMFLIILAAFVIFIIGKGPRFLPAIILSVFSFIFVAIGIGVAIANSIIAGALDSAMMGLNEAIYGLINNLLPNVIDAVGGLLMSGDIRFIVNLNIYCGAGWWLITLSLLATTALAYIAPVLQKKRLLKETNSVVEKSNEIIEEA